MVLFTSMRRLAHLLAVVVRHSLAHGLTIAASRWPPLARRLRLPQLTGPERLRTVIEDMGGTFIKFGQMLALQPDILPIAYCNALFNLLDRVAPFPFTHVEQTFMAEFGKTTDEIFDFIDHQPIATASIGQVHAARLNGRAVAVKVQRPNVETDFYGDIRLMTATIRMVRYLRLKMFYWLIEPTTEFIAWTSEELDYRREARYMEQQRRNAQQNPQELVPEVFADYVSRHTLVVEFVDGLNLLDYLRAIETGDELTLKRLEVRGFDPNQFVYNVLENFLSDAYRFGMFHADLHPANLMILPNNVVGYIDFGITGMLSKFSRQNIVSLTMALGSGDLEGMCAAFFKISTVNKESDVEAFRRGMREQDKEWYETLGHTRRLKKNATLVMLDMLMLSRKTGIYPERDVVKYIRSAIAIDGLITRAAPEFDLSRHLESICQRQLMWHARSAVFRYETMLSWGSAGGHLMQDGAFRAAQAVSRIALAELPAHAGVERSHKGNEDELRQRAWRLATLVLIVSALVSVTGGSTVPGINLLTAEVIFVMTTVVMLMGTIRRLA